MQAWMRKRQRQLLQWRLALPRKLMLIIFASLLFSGQYLREGRAEDDPYAALNELITIASKNITTSSCSVRVVLSFDGFPSRLPLFRDAWLNRDFSVDFYNQRRKQVFLFVIVKRAAELITEGLYARAAAAPLSECLFQVDIKSFDKFGQPRVSPAASWRFTRTQAAKVAWDTFDPKNFQEIAIDYKIASGMNDWISDEPEMTSNETRSPATGAAGCDLRFLRANAIFIRATTYCKKNYMDSRAGNYALAMSKRCTNLTKAELMPKVQSAMNELDRVVSKRGRQFGCRWVDEIEQSVARSLPGK